MKSKRTDASSPAPAAGTSGQSTAANGGVDLDSQWLDLQTRGQGLNLAVNDKPGQISAANIRIQGLVPDVFDIRSLPSLAPLLGIPTIIP